VGCYRSFPLTRISSRDSGSIREKGTRVTPVFNDLVDPTLIFFLEEVDPRHHEASFSSFDNVAKLTKGKRE
jgi:hypothetical protein